ncbi:CopD family protein [Aurantibacillus circumpalustris]|uniref:CopD family protein n=1 Tax=Aurantibacillus circumpalustris TaxID=3036359 RepID=UPI00295BA6A9|nr:CopD family protein [Aurantibacillus circumpalustris]
MDFSYIKALHIIFVVCWFAALFYIVRLFIYTAEAQKKDDIAKPILTEQLLIMQTKLWYIIGWPSLFGTYIFGFWMLWENPSYLEFSWMWLKLIAVGVLTVYHFGCQRILSQQKKGLFRLSSLKLRLLNELATVLLVAIVFLVVVKSTSGLFVGLLGLLGFAATLMIGVLIYKKSRKQDKIDELTKKIDSTSNGKRE